jgi:hypothetical protein
MSKLRHKSVVSEDSGMFQMKVSHMHASLNSENSLKAKPNNTTGKTGLN